MTGISGRIAAAAAALVITTGAAAATMCGGVEPPPVTDRAVRQAPPLPEPAVRRPFRDPEFGACLVRLTDRVADTGWDGSKGLKNAYSRVQAFNADQSRILLLGTDATWHLYDAATMRPVHRLPFEGPVDPRWDATDPNLLHYIDGTRLFAHDIRAGPSRLVRDFAADFPGQTLAAVWGRYEGSPSIDGRYLGLMAEDADWKPVAFLVYDRVADRIVARRDLRGVPGVEEDVDHVGMSPLGTFFVAAFDRVCPKGTSGTAARPCGLMVYDRDLGHGRGLARLMGHYDVALDAAGREVIVYQDVETDDIAMIALATGERTALHPIDFSHGSIGLHFSGQAVRRPGWALVSTHVERRRSHTWMDDQVFAIELKASGRTVRLAHARSLVDPKQAHDYWAEPHATVDRDFTRVLFTTNWGRSGSTAVETMLIDLPTGLLPRGP